MATHVVGEGARLSKPLTTAVAHVGLLATVLPAKEQTVVIRAGREAALMVR